MSHVSIDRISILKDRALMFSGARDFFMKKGVLEVDVALLAQSAPIDVHIDLVEATCSQKPSYLHSSPEYGMKRLLAEGIGDIYQMSHVFRDGERGERHLPEFTMVEWYRLGISFEQMIQETIEFLQLFLEGKSVESLTWREAFETFGKKLPEEIQDKDHFFAFEVEPHLGRNGFTILKDFPAEQAALAKVRFNGNERVAERFEIFYHGMELANGYHELTDPSEQKKRIEEANLVRQSLGKKSYPIDQYFLSALRKGIPDCCGVAVGFDRLMMLRHAVKDIQEVVPINWRET